MSTSSPLPYLTTTELDGGGGGGEGGGHYSPPLTHRSDFEGGTVFTTTTSRSRSSRSRLDAWDDAVERRSKMGNTVATLGIPEEMEDIDPDKATYFQ